MILTEKQKKNSINPACPEKNKQVETDTFEVNNDSKSSVLFLVPADTDLLSENSSDRQFRQYGELNEDFGLPFKQNSKQLSEVIAVNIKLLSIIAHDLRSPFTSIMLALEFINDKLEHNTITDIKECVKIASEAAKSSLELLNELFAWAVTQNKGKLFTPVNINLCEILNSGFETLNIAARQKHINLSHTISSGLNVKADLQMVKTIFRNLISNSIKYSESGSEVVVSANVAGRFVEISIKDNGSGISFSDQRNLFKNDSIKSSGGNNYIYGLGLLLCKEFVESNGGEIEINSKPGSGSEVKFTLPRYITKSHKS